MVLLILLNRKTPNSILTVEALLRRLEPNDFDYPYFQDMLKRLKSGYEGEHRVDREWIEMPYLDEHYLLLNYEFENEFGHTHQIDTLLLTKNFLLLLEIKNIAGRVEYNEQKHQFLRIKPDGMVNTLTNPFDQLNRHEEFIHRLLAKMKLSLPIEKAIIMANTSTIIGEVPNSIPIFHASGLRFFVKKCLRKYPPKITNHQLEKLAKFFMSQLKPRNYDINISSERIRKGVLCENCNYQVEMKYRLGVWTCPKCNVQSEKAFYRALNDYRLLISNQITNQKFREFFNINSHDATTKILDRLNLEKVGKNRGRYYIIPEDILIRGNSTGH